MLPLRAHAVTTSSTLAREAARKIGSGASRISEPLPPRRPLAIVCSTWRIFRHVSSAARVEMPMSMNLALLELCALSIHWTNLSSWSASSQPPVRRSDSAMHRAMLVSSVHCPARSENLPPPVIVVSGLKLPASRNSTAVPRASPSARPIRQPRCLSSAAAMIDLSPFPVYSQQLSIRDPQDPPT